MEVHNINFMVEKKLDKRLLFRQLIDWIHLKKSCLYGNSVCDIEEEPDDLLEVYDEHDSDTRFIKDLRSAKKSIRIDITSCPENGHIINILADELQNIQRNKASINIRIRAEKRQDLPYKLQHMAVENPFIGNPIAIIDSKIVWYGKPNTRAEFTAMGKAVPTKYRPILRYEGTFFAMQVSKLLNIKDIRDKGSYGTMSEEERDNFTDEVGDYVSPSFASYVSDNITCSVCRRPMVLRKGKSFFFGCSGYPNCKNTEPMDVETVEDYLATKGEYGMRCRKCGASLEARKSRFGVYTTCCNEAAYHIFKLDEI